MNANIISLNFCLIVIIRLSFKGQYLIYLSVKWALLGWYVGIKKSGKPKKGSKTWYPPHQKAIQFVAKKQISSQSFPDTFDFGNGNSDRVRREAMDDAENNSERVLIDATSTNNDLNARFSTNESNHSPILYIDDERAGIIDVNKTTTVDKVLPDLTQ